MIDYQLEPELSADEFIDVLIRSTLGERRPIDDRERIDLMLRNADLIVTARSNGRLVGVSPITFGTGFVCGVENSRRGHEESSGGRGESMGGVGGWFSREIRAA
jgi:hypothetical protein